MSGYIGQFSYLTKLSTLTKKLEFIRQQTGFESLGVVYYTKKTLLKYIGGLEFTAPQPIQTDIGLEDLFELSINQFNKLGFNQTLKNNKNFKVILKNLYLDEEPIGYIFLKTERELQISNENKIESIIYLAEHFDGFISSKYSGYKSKQQSRILSNKLLEIESLIDLTEIIYNQNDNIKGLFENILFTFISTLNSSSGMIVLKDEKSGFFNVISIFNIPEQDSSRKIIRASKGILKELNTNMTSVLVEEVKKYELLKFAEKNSLVGPLISENDLRGAIIIANKESISGINRYTKEDLRLFDSLTKKVSLAYENIKLIDSLKNSTKLVDNIMSSITTGIIKIDVLGEIEYVNDSAEKVFGFNTEEVLQNHYMAIFIENNDLISLIEKIETDPKVVYENNFKIKDLNSEDREINLTLSPVFDENNEFSGLVLAFEDLSNVNKIKSTFKKYVSENIVDELLNTEQSLELGGGKNKVCMLFCDIRGFTAMSERMNPEDVVSLLNNYFQAMIDVVFENNGTLDKIIGDELMVLYGVPIESENDPQKAVNTAKEMFVKLEEFNRNISSKGYPEIKVGIGINYGEVISGNIGSDRQMNYTVIGDNVNLAARLCSHAKPGQIVISKSVFESLDDKSGFESMNPIELKGKSKKVQNWIFDAKKN
jgi:PAS domain S-box-containing protein